MLGKDEKCQYNFQCETDCCIEKRKKGGKGGKGGRKGRGDDDDDDDNDDDRRVLQGSMGPREGPGGPGGRGGPGGHGGPGGRGPGELMCQAEWHCEDKWEMRSQTIWNFFAGLFIAGLAMIGGFQCWYYKKQLLLARRGNSRDGHRQLNRESVVGRASDLPVQASPAHTQNELNPELN